MSASVPILPLHLRDSPRWRAAGVAVHAVALGSVLATPLPTLVRVLLGAALLLAPLRARGRYPSVRRIELYGDGRCTIDDARGSGFEGRLVAGSLALPGLIVLQLERRGRRLGLWLASDAFRVDELRRLRVRLRVAA